MIKGVKDQRCETEIGKIKKIQKKRGKNAHTSSIDLAAMFR